MKETNQDMGWLILFFIASGFSGFIVSSWLIDDNIQAQLLVGTIIMITFFFLFITLYFHYQKKGRKGILQGAMNRGNYQEVYSQIDSDGKEMNEFWELKMLAAFHCGAIQEFHRLYQNYMNEINEATNLNRYMIAILYDLLIASETSKKPVSFMKNLQQPSQKYQKADEYSLIRNLRMGLQEFYKPQKNLVKVYFEKYLMQADVVSKPLSFYLYYVMTLAMNDCDHPQVLDYYNKTMSVVFNDASLQQIEQLKNWMMQKQKGIGIQNNMDNDFNNRRSPFANNATDDELKRTFTYQQPAYRRSSQREQNDQFAAQSNNLNDYQKDFDMMNSSMQPDEPFQLYKADQTDPFATNNRTFTQNEPQSMRQDDFSEEADLDPTWFARRGSTSPQSETHSSLAYQQASTPRVQAGAPIEPQQQDPYLRSGTFQHQEEPQPAMERQFGFNTRRNEEPAFVNQRTTQRTSPFPTTPQQSNPMAQPSGENPFGNIRREQMDGQRQTRQQIHPNTQSTLDPFAQPQEFPTQPQQPNQQPFLQGQAPLPNERAQMRRTPTNPAMEQMHHTQQDRFSRFQEKEQTSAIPQEELNRKPQVSMQSEEPVKNKRFARKKKQADPFDFAPSQSAQAVAPQVPQTSRIEKTNPRKEVRKERVTSVENVSSVNYRTYVKHNILIFFLTLLDAAVVAIASSSFVYTAFFNKYSSITSQIVPDIIVLASILALVITYLTAGIHTGYTIMKKSTRNWKGAVKVITFPIMVIVYLLIGAICEIPYFIFAVIKSNKEG